MSCNIIIPFSGPAAVILDKARNAVTGQGGSFEGDLHSGAFDVSLMSNRVAGTYQVNEQELHLSITDKPMFIPCNAIESFLKSKLN